MQLKEKANGSAWMDNVGQVLLCKKKVTEELPGSEKNVDWIFHEIAVI